MSTHLLRPAGPSIIMIGLSILIFAMLETVMALNLVCDALRDALVVRLRRR